MGDLDFKVKVRGTDAIWDIQEAIGKAILRGAVDIGDDTEETAKRKIRIAGAVWTGELLQSFDVDIRPMARQTIIVVENTADHAAPIEYGARYTNKGPPISALVPWVRTKMHGFEVPDEAEVPDIENIENDEFEVQVTEGEGIDIRSIADRETIEKAFWLQQHIKETGIEPLKYMERAERAVEKTGSATVRKHIERELRKA